MSATQPPWRREQQSDPEPRRATRHEAQLDARLLFQVSIVNEQTDAAPPRTLKLVGHTRNISETGLAFIVPSLRIGEQFIHILGSHLLITLYLPSGHVEIHATPVRYEQLPRQDRERGYLIGVRITEMADEEWVRMVEYVRLIH
ncbi:MAG: PilZ domain-containing protein [Pyrinomonadaceae bacterium]